MQGDVQFLVRQGGVQFLVMQGGVQFLVMQSGVQVQFLVMLVSKLTVFILKFIVLQALNT